MASCCSNANPICYMNYTYDPSGTVGIWRCISTPDENYPRARFTVGTTTLTNNFNLGTFTGNLGSGNLLINITLVNDGNATLKVRSPLILSHLF